MNQIIQTAIIDRNIKVGHDEHFFIFVYCHERQTINHRLIGMNFYISLHLLVTWKCFVWFNFKQSNIILCIIFSRLIRIWQQYPHVSGGVSDCLLRSYTVCNAFLRIGSADHKTNMVLTNDFTETSTELTHEKMSFFLKTDFGTINTQSERSVSTARLRARQAILYVAYRLTCECAFWVQKDFTSVTGDKHVSRSIWIDQALFNLQTKDCNLLFAEELFENRKNRQKLE